MKRRPVATHFDPTNLTHVSFVKHAAILFANIFRIPSSSFQEMDLVEISRKVLSEHQKKQSKEIFRGRPDDVEEIQKWEDSRQQQKTQTMIRELCDKNFPGNFLSELVPQQFSELSSECAEFLISATNLRTKQYQFPEMTRSQILRSIFKIDPAIVTSSSLIAGLGSIELLKLFQKRKSLDHFRNSFLNLNISLLTNSAPRSVTRSRYGPDRWISMWDRIDLRLGGDVTLKELLKELEMRTRLRVDMIAARARMIYMAMMPMHRNRLPQL